MVINGIIDLDNGELLEATGKHRISALDIQGSETAELKLTFYKNGSAVTDNSVVSGAVIDFGVKADADYTGTSYLIYHDTFSASTDGLEYSGTPTWATAEVETALGNESSVKLHGQVKVVISGVTYYSQVFEVEIHNNVIQAAGTTNSVIYPRLIQSTSDPTVNDDSLDGYGVSSLWLNTSSNAVHVLMDNTAGAAVWAGFLGLTNGQLANNLVFNDDLKAVFGTGSDLEIYHTGTASVIHDRGTGGLKIDSNYLQIRDANQSETLAKFTQNGAVELFYNNSKKFETTDTGATVTGKLVVSGDLDVDGVTTSFDSTVVNVADPVFGIGGSTPPGSQDNKDRGVSFRYHDGASAKVGFYGWDNSEDSFVFLTDTNDDSTEVFSGTLADLKASKTLLEDGSASAPSVSFSSDSNTGIYRASADNLAFSTGGTEAARFDSSGRLGISTDNPSHKLNISVSDSDDGIVLQKAGSSNDLFKFSMDGTNDKAELFQYSQGNVIFAVRPGNFGYINTGQNFGIGTTSPSTILEISGSGAGAAGLDLSQGESSSISNRLFFTNATASEGIALYNLSGTLIFSTGAQPANTSGDARMYLNSTGLGIGYDNPSHPIHVRTEKDGNYVARITNTEATAGSNYGLKVDGGSNSSDISFEVANYLGDINLRVTGDGKCGIGGAPVEKLTIEDGHIRMSDGYKIDWGGTNVRIDGSNADGYFRAFIGGFEAMRLNSTGLGITEKLYHLDDDNTYLQFNTDQINLATDGIDRLRLESAAVKCGRDLRITQGVGYSNFLLLSHNDSNAFVKNNFGDLYIENTATGKDTIFKNDNDSGTATELLRLDGSASTIHIPNDVQLRLGGGSDMRIVSESSQNVFSFYNHDTLFRTLTDDVDIIFKTTTGGTTSEVLRLDGSTGNVGIGGVTSPSANADLTLGGGELCMAETTTPTADANFGKIYCKSDNKLYFQDGAGTEHEIAFV